jgi:GNAT superfamily N-acetyltransferase
LEIKPITDDVDLALALELHNQVRPDDALTLADVRSFIEQTSEYADYIAAVDGVAVGMAYACLLHERSEPLVDLVVAPAKRRRGLGGALYARVSEWASERGRQALDVAVEEADPDSAAFANRRGFVEVGREIRLALDLLQATPPRAEPPVGIEIVTWAERPDAARGIHEVAVEAFPDIPGNENESVRDFEHWLAAHMTGSGDRPDATFVALHGDEVVGYSKFSLTEAQPTTAHHDLTGVKRAWRGRGIARALKSAQIEWARRNGYERLVTRNEERNAPIKRLNEEFGYRPAGARILMRGPLSGAT